MLRERNKERVRDALIDAAFELFASEGFEATTIDAIAEKAGVARRTFFRYFPSKEAVLFPDREARLSAFRDHLQTDLGPVEAVRRGMLQLADDYTKRKKRVVRQQRIIASSGVTLAYDFERDQEWEQAVAELLGDRKGESEAVRRRARLAAGALLGVSRVVLRDWYESDGRGDLKARGEEALSLVLAGFEASLPTKQKNRKAS